MIACFPTSKRSAQEPKGKSWLRFARLLLCFCVIAVLMTVRNEGLRPVSAGENEASANKLTISLIAPNADRVFEQLDRLAKEKKWLDYFKTADRAMECHGEKLYQVSFNFYENFGVILRRRIHALPKEAYDVFREYYDTAAGAQFSGWERCRDRKMLVEIVERYFPSSYTDEALLKLGSLDFESGKYRRAAKWFRMLIDFYPNPDKPREDALVKAAFAYSASGDAKKILELAKYARENGMDKKPAGVLPEEGSQTIGQLLMKLTDAALHRRVDRARLKELLANWPTLRGNQQRNRLAERDLVPGGIVGVYDRIRNYGSPVESVNQGRYLGISQQRVQQDVTDYYPFFPAVYGGKVYIPAQHFVGVIDLKNGKRLRPFAAPAMRYPEEEENKELENNRQLIYSLHVDRDGLYSSLTTGKWGGTNYMGIDVRGKMYERNMFAFDKPGRTLWSTRLFCDVSENAHHAVPTAPVRVGDKMIVPAYDNSEWTIAKLVAFNVHSGKCEWMTPICYNKLELTMFGAQSREPLISPLAERDGIVYFCTNLGALAAVDGETGRILWIRAYDEIEIEAAVRHITIKREMFWENSPPVISDDVVITTPLDSRLCYAFELETGKLRWNIKYDHHGEDKGPYPTVVNRMVGVSSGKVIFSGSRVMAIDIKTGLRIWKVELETNRYAVAAGCLSKRYVYIPHRRGFCVYNIRNGDRVHEHIFKRPTEEAGNLLIAGDYFITTSKMYATVFRGVPLEKRSRTVRRSAAKESD